MGYNKEAQKKYREKNKEELKEKRREKRKEKSEYNKKYYAENQPIITAKRRAKYALSIERKRGREK